MVFEHSCIPLNVQLRKARQEEQNVSQDQEFRKLLAVCIQSLKTGISGFTEHDWSYDYANLFTERIRGRPLHLHDKPTIIGVLRSRTFWYPRLKPSMKLIVKHLVDDGKLLHLKEILHVADGVICQLLVSFPEILITSSDESAYFVTDQISNSIISSCLLNYSKVVKEIKDFRKEIRYHAFEKKRMDRTNRRHMSWVVPIIDYYNTELYARNSKEKMFRVCTFAQTRSTGLADSKMVEETIDLFIKTVTSPVEFRPNDLLLQAIEEVTSETVLNADGTSPHFRASMSTSACRESSRKKEGKFGYLRSLVAQSILPVPEMPSPDQGGGTIGTPLWWRAFSKAEAGDRDIFSVNVAGIRENGKCRVVTSGSFYKDVLLQPFSHLTIEMAKANPILSAGFQAGRLGWEFIQGIEGLDPQRGEILFEDDVSMLSFDWTKATDNPSHASGRAIMKPLLQKIGLDEHTIEVILRVWVGTKYLYRNKEYIGEMVRGIPMGDPLTKTNLSLAHPVCDRYAKLKLGRRIITVGTGNGDDGNIIAAGPNRFKYFEDFCEAAEMLGYQVSKLDTFVTPDWGTYCEEVFRVPIDRFHTVKLGNRLKDSRISPYLDHPKGRLIIDTRKDRKDFSSDPKGKYTLLGKEMEYVNKDGSSGIGFLYSVSSAMQDICLGLRNRYEPVYLPRQVFGVGKPPSQWSVTSWHNAIKSQRQWPRRTTIAVMKELLGDTKKLLTQLRGVVREQPHFAGEGVVEVLKIPDDDPIKRHRIIKADEWKLFPPGVVEKLVNGNRLVRESKLSGYYLFHRRMTGILEKQVDLFEVARSLSTETAPFPEEEELSVLRRFSKAFSDKPWLLRQEMEEDLYTEGIIKIMADADPLRVDMELGYLKRFQSRVRSDTPYKREMDLLENWFYDNYEQILRGERPDGPPPTGIISDDEVILDIIVNGQISNYLIVSDDIRMARKAARMRPDKLIMRVSCHDWVHQSAPSRQYHEILLAALGTPCEILIDQGSLDTFNDSTGATYSMGVPVIDPLIREWSGDVPRRPPKQQSEIYSRFRARPKITTDLLFDTIQVMSRKGTFMRKRVRTTS
jgi:hypothetical protein